MNPIQATYELYSAGGEMRTMEVKILQFVETDHRGTLAICWMPSGRLTSVSLDKLKLPQWFEEE